MELIAAAGYGFFGGLVRSLVGIMKLNNIQRSFRWQHLAITLAMSGVIGMFVGMLVNADYRITMLAGYAGIDFIEGIYKSQLKRGKRR